MKLDLNLVKDHDVSFMERWYPFEYNHHKINSPTHSNDGLEHGEHYKLLGFLSTLYENCNIIDGGSRTGMSALALGANKRNSVRSYDLIQVSPAYRSEYTNISFFQKDLLTESPEVLLQSPLIFLDLDPHDGVQETRFFEILRNIGYRGIVILDDISTPGTHFMFPGMVSFWNSIPEKKWDISKVGHGSGTGLVAFNMDLEVTL
jgi:hypothetical protein